MVGEEREHDEPKEHGRNAFQKEEPLPPREPEASVQAEQRSGDRAAHDRFRLAHHAAERDRLSGIEAGRADELARYRLRRDRPRRC